MSKGGVMRIGLKNGIINGIETINDLTNFIDQTAYEQYSNIKAPVDLNQYCNIFVQVLNFFWNNYINKIEEIEKSECTKLLDKMKSLLTKNAEILETYKDKNIDPKQIEAITQKRNEVMRMQIKLLQAELEGGNDVKNK